MASWRWGTSCTSIVRSIPIVRATFSTPMRFPDTPNLGVTVAERLRLEVTRFKRWGLPLVNARLEGVFTAALVVSSADPYTTLAWPLARDLRGESFGRGRRVVPSDTGSTIVPIIRL